MKQGIKLLAVLLCLSLLLPLLPSTARAEEAQNDDPATRPGRVLVALGDSFASGEGIGSFFGEELPMSEKCKNEDWLAHRSTRAWACQLRLPGADGTMLENLGSNFFFAACSGAVTDNINVSYDAATGVMGRQSKEYDRDGCAGATYVPGQLDVFYNNPNLNRYDVDYVTLSIGGNDVGFEAIVGEAGQNPVYGGSVYDLVEDRLKHFDDPGGIADKLTATYKRIAEAAPNATIIVTGYPELLDYSGKGIFFSEYGAKFINDGVTQFNWRIEKLIRKLKQEGVKIEFVDVAKEFRGHQAYSNDEYINGVKLGTQPQDLKTYGKTEVSPYSVHPNARGAEIYAKCVQARIDELEAQKDPNRQTSERQNIVLVLDNSGSMSGTPIQQTRSAAKSFIDTVLAGDASIGIVTFESSAEMRANFSRDAAYLKGIVDGIYTGDMTNTEAGLSTAAGMLNGITKGKRIIILMSDGLANVGRTGADLMEYIESLKRSGIYFYTLGFFEDLSGSDLSEGQSSMENIASPGCHYEVEDAEQLGGFFTDIADQVNGQNYAYARIACPVDVEVSYGGETLSSVTGNTRTSFGTLTFEAGEGDSYSGDNRTKILRLREDGTKYQIVIRGNGEGTMHYTAGFMDANGEYTDLREIEDVPITPQTCIYANADRSAPTTLQVDADGDGIIDQAYSVNGSPSAAPAPSSGKWWLYVLIGVIAAAAAAAVILILRRKPAAGAAVDSGKWKVESGQAPQVPAGDFICASCGARHDGASRFCMRCGAPLPAASAGAFREAPSLSEPSASAKAVSKTPPLSESPAITEAPPAPQPDVAPDVIDEAPPAPQPDAAPEAFDEAPPVPKSAPEFKFCRNCGAKVRRSAAFCLNCGTRF